MKDLNLIERKGDVVFYEDINGKLYQKIGLSDPIKVKDGKIGYMIMGKIGVYTLKYEKNGTTGYSIWKGNVCLEDNFWDYQKVLEAVYTM